MPDTEIPTHAHILRKRSSYSDLAQVVPEAADADRDPDTDLASTITNKENTATLFGVSCRDNFSGGRGSPGPACVPGKLWLMQSSIVM